MTGEVSLTGRVLPIGGVKQKLLAAHRAGITTVLIPQRNEPDLDDVPAEVLEKLDVHTMGDVRDVLALALWSPRQRPRGRGVGGLSLTARQPGDLRQARIRDQSGSWPCLLSRRRGCGRAGGVGGGEHVVPGQVPDIAGVRRRLRAVSASGAGRAEGPLPL